MSSSTSSPAAPESQTTSPFATDVQTGLSGTAKTLPSKYFYDLRGSKLFDQICELPEYYPTRTEFAIMQTFAAEMGEQIGQGAMLIEFGSGSSVKTRLLLDELIEPVAYVPVDVSGEHLGATAQSLAVAYPNIEILPVCADFTQPFTLPMPTQPATHEAVYFPGSTIGNFAHEDAIGLLKHIATLCGNGGGLLIGIDLQKDIAVLEAAYNDRQGVTAEFNLNLLHRINSELDANFEVDHFRHVAIYNSGAQRIEMYLESQQRQTIHVCGKEIGFAAGERICTELSHKYTVESFAAMAQSAGLMLRRHWQDDRGYFAVLHFARLDKA